MFDHAPIRISLAHVSERGRERLRLLLGLVATRSATRAARVPADACVAGLPRLENGELVVPRECARETWTVLSHTCDACVLAVAYRLSAAIQGRGWSRAEGGTSWDRPDAAAVLRRLLPVAPAEVDGAEEGSVPGEAAGDAAAGDAVEGDGAGDVRRRITTVASSDQGPLPNSIAWANTRSRMS